MTRVVELIEDIQKKIDPGHIDLKTVPKTIPAGRIGVVVDTIVPGYSMYVNFGRGIGIVAMSERMVKDITSSTDELIEYLNTRHNPTII